MTGRSAAMQPADDEHQRFAHYLQELADVSSQDEVGLVGRVLRDPDTVMAQSAVVRHLDRRAAQLLTDAGFPDWFEAMVIVTAEWEFLVHRLREWMVLRSITIDDTRGSEDLLAASDWCQRTAARVLTSSAALRLLAERGRTRRVRAAAGLRLAQQRR
ncbi:hypothetical protein GCM10010517_70580 [Streptosporangium fragile]|uniref:Uncharacterized protein n=1 Tax=Streptosporangium fragile TaxID=46186 RepID=A0ABN3W8H1_9ACTN